MLARSLAKQARLQEALPYAHRAVEIYSRLRMPEEIEEAQALLKECEEKI